MSISDIACAEILGTVAANYANQTTYLKHPRPTPAVIASILTDLVFLSITFDSEIYNSTQYPKIQSELQGLATQYNQHVAQHYPTAPFLKFKVAENLEIKAPSWKTILQARFEMIPKGASSQLTPKVNL